ncbi:hypothetical protein C5167_023149 [Papaver somniferum]|uniref:Protein DETOXIFICATION n=1 Tax=Papaver somniferum TaxID=3469 RepID=A0A4Y7JMU2_PAPSO|nr:hypothetical protein C5167_023149 [Papaver somniferum]
MGSETPKSILNAPLLESREEEVNGLKLFGENDSTSAIISKESSEILVEVKKQLWLAGPLISVNVLQYCLQLISVMFVGHLGKLSLSGASMATSLASVTGFSLLMGMGSALDTLCGQILLAVGQDPEISFEAGVYARFMIPSIFAHGLLQCEVRFLQTQSIVFPMMLSSAITAILHILVCWVLVFKTGLGFRGAAMANAISYWINTLLLAIYIKLDRFLKGSTSGYPQLYETCYSISYYDVLRDVVFRNDGSAVGLNTSGCVFMISSGLSGAISTRVSNELGAGNSQAARLAVQVVLIMTVTEAMVIGSIMILVRRLWGYAYSNDEEVVSYVATMVPIIAVSTFLDAIQCVLSGTARGCGWQKIGASINLGANYLVGIPSAILLAFVLNVGGKAKQATSRVYEATIPAYIVS